MTIFFGEQGQHTTLRRRPILRREPPFARTPAAGPLAELHILEYHDAVWATWKPPAPEHYGLPLVAGAFRDFLRS